MNAATGRMPDMLQDCHRKLHKWLANRIDSKRHAREAAQAIRNEALQLCRALKEHPHDKSAVNNMARCLEVRIQGEKRG